MCVIGYDDYFEGGAFQVMNSWGKEWGEDGLFWMRYNDFAGGNTVRFSTGNSSRNAVAMVMEIIK